MGARAGKYKFAARDSKYKLGARASKYKLGARAGGQAKGRGPENTNTLWSEIFLSETLGNTKTSRKKKKKLF